MDKALTDDVLAGRYLHTDLMVDKAHQSTIFDSDGNEYIDYIMGNLTQLRGYLRFGDAINKSKAEGLPLNVGDNPFELQYQLAKKLLKIAKKKSLRYTNSGSEAIHLAIRVARATTKRSTILKFTGHYHGWLNEEIFSFVPGQYSAGIPANNGNNVIVIEWNNIEQMEHIFNDFGSQLACVLCEPILAHSGTIKANDGFLEKLLSLAKLHGVKTIFDECITGFRVGLTGAQGYYNLYPDIVVYSKALSNGIPFGVVLFDDESSCLNNGEVFHASTYDGNLLSVVGCLTTIDGLMDGKVYKAMETSQVMLQTGVLEIAAQYDIPILMQSAPGLFQFYFTELNEICSYEAAMTTDYKLYRRFVLEMKRQRIILSDGDLSNDDCNKNWIGSWFLSSAHCQSDIDRTLEAVDESFNVLFK